MASAPTRSPTPAQLTNAFLAELRKHTAKDPKLAGAVQYQLLRIMAKSRAEALRGPALRATGGVVPWGPFAGMKFHQSAAEGCFLPKLFGYYEAELHPHWSAFRKSRKYRTIIDIGAAEGFYAVGLARMFPEAKVIARDTNEASHVMMRELAKKNGVADRVEVGGLFGHADFAAYEGQPNLVLCDIEGGEKELLDPAKAPALQRADIVVEVHEGMDRTIPGILGRRFGKTHDMTTVQEEMRAVRFPPNFRLFDSVDKLVAVWEFRSSPTPWLVMRAKNFPK